MKQKRSRMVLDEESGEYKPRYGYKSIDKDGLGDAFIEHKESMDLANGNDPFLERAQCVALAHPSLCVCVCVWWLLGRNEGGRSSCLRACRLAVCLAPQPSDRHSQRCIRGLKEQFLARVERCSLL